TPTGLVAIMRGEKPGKTLAFRADIDALPIEEYEGNAVVSKNHGVMHACGHDGHTASLLGTAKVLSQIKELVEGEIRLIFQPAEEAPPGGAAPLVKAGVMKGVDYIFAMHGHVYNDPGIFFVKPGPLFAATYTFDLNITGMEAHAAFPFNGIDSILLASNVVVALNSIIPRTVDNAQQAVLTITKFNGGNAYNIMPEKVTLGGTLRVLDSRCEKSLLEKIPQVSAGICAVYGAKCEFVLHEGYNIVENDEKAAAAVRQVLESHFGAENILTPEPLMGGEDFSEYLKEVPGCYYRFGIRKPKADGSICQAHKSHYEFNDDALKYTIESAVRVLLEAPALL
ncbi:MAG: amidohydrolase, partial [Oscillospiraceae bacterium]